MTEYVIEFTRRNVHVTVCGSDEEATARLAVLLAEARLRNPSGEVLDQRVGKVLPLDPWSRKVACCGDPGDCSCKGKP